MSRRLFLMLCALALGLSHPARAGDSAPDPTGGYRAATWIALSGGINAGAGFATFGLGLPMVVEGPDHTPPGAYGIGMVLYCGGYTALAASGGMMAGGSLAARQVLVKRTGLRVPVWPSALAMGAWGGTLVLALAVPALTDVRPVGWLTLTSFATTHALGAVQLIVNRRAWRSLPEQAPAPRVTMGLAPQAGRHYAGLSLIGMF